MKLNKTLALVALVAGSMVAGIALQAQDAPQNPPPGGGARGRGGPSIEMLTTNLSLTAEQVPKVKAALTDQQTKMKALRDDTSLSQEDRRAKMKEIRDAFTAKMKEILTPDQFEKWQKMAPAGRQRPGGGGAPGGPGGGTPPPAKN